MSHDIRNNLMIVNGLISLLQETYDIDHVNKINSILKKTDNLLTHSLKLAEAGQIIDKKVDVDLNLIIELLKSDIIPDSVEFHNNFLPTVKGDKSKINQIFTNLLNNALKHGNPTKILVTSEKTENSHHLKISNNGDLIPQELIDKIFERGYSTDSRSPGYGLSIITRIVEAHGWKIELLNNDLTTFLITIPFDQ